MNGLSIDQCPTSQWKRYRDIRLRSLAEAPDAFWHTFAEESTFDENTWRETMGMPGKAILLATRGGGDVGVVSIGPPTWDEQADPNYYDLGSFWVAPQARRTEVSRELLAKALDYAREQGASGVTLWLIGENNAARRLYEAAGFVYTGREGRVPAPRSEIEREMRLDF